ncbi:hypothetical protein GNI_140780 [Gregarina niphandrodes]|uniref:Transmembrane protein n=1 Tax=Gregarina niphandrodes TaxID=110365 RepID=A0A023B0C6_GRENI|nr:hypothetical protein GNI_140780 [Gregarina niphandrodes]EZG45102.1 hypothetical protein GNI_140780 [Gregarina niphandrodes]|eukprot:XP_011132565.1 hypothetical protein GNI_140780 [Gregarina niphandrodes]
MRFSVGLLLTWGCAGEGEAQNRQPLEGLHLEKPAPAPAPAVAGVSAGGPAAVEGMGRRRRGENSPWGLQLMSATASAFDRSAFPPCFTDADCVNGLNERGVCNFDGEAKAANLLGAGRKSRLSGLPNLANEENAAAFEKYLKRYLWSVFRTTVTKEPFGVCTKQDEPMSPPVLAESRASFVDDMGSGEESWDVVDEPLEYDLPSVLKKFAPANRYRIALDQLQSALNIGSLGEIQCSPITKVGVYDGKGTPTHGHTLNGVPIHGAFLIKYTPLLTSPAAGLPLQVAPNSQSVVRYISEPYEYIVSGHKLGHNLAPGGTPTVPSHRVLQRREMKGILGMVAELASVARLHQNPDDRLHVLHEYIDPQALAMLRPSIMKLLESYEPRIYLSLRELTHGVEMGNGVLTLMCDNPGEGVANVEITYFLPSLYLLSALGQLVEPGAVRQPITLKHFLSAVDFSTVDQGVCPARILCVDSH